MENQSNQRYNFYLQSNDSQCAVLLIHGITGTPSEMRYFGKELHKQGFSVYCNALPRHCGSLDELKQVTWKEIASACKEDFLFLSKNHKYVFVAGLSMGALMAVHLAFEFKEKVSGIIALAPTLFYDGWALSKGKVLMHAVWHIPFLRNSIQIREGWPYGLKDESARENIERFYKNAKLNQSSKKTLLFGSPFFPLACLYQHSRFVKFVKKEIPLVGVPIIIMHAQEDDMVSFRNAQYLFNSIGSKDKTLIPLEDSYHMLTIDKQKDLVAQKAIQFIKSHANI